MNATRRATRIFLRVVNQKNFFVQKLPDLAPVLHKLMQLKRATDGHSIKYLMTVEGAWERSPQLLCKFCNFAEKNCDFNTVVITFRAFWSDMNRVWWGNLGQNFSFPSLFTNLALLNLVYQLFLYIWISDLYLATPWFSTLSGSVSYKRKKVRNFFRHFRTEILWILVFFSPSKNRRFCFLPKTIDSRGSRRLALVCRRNRGEIFGDHI